MPVVLTLIEVRAADVTVTCDDPVTPSIAALILAVPAASPCTTPLLPELLLTVAAAVLSEDQVTWAVRFCVEPSLKVPAAVKLSLAFGCSEAPDGATAIELSVAFDTVRVVESDTEPTFAVMVVDPGVNPETRPEGATVATAVADDVHEVTWLVRFRVLPSLNVPVTVNCCVVCLAMVAASGLTAMDRRLARVTVSVA